MTLEHRDLTTGDVHEPKGISDSTSADAGKVITPLSGGESELRFLTPSEVGVDFYYLEWDVLENAGIISLTAATDPQLYTNADFTKINSANLPGANIDEQNGLTFDSTNYDIEVTLDGVYRISFWANVESSINNTKIGFRPTLNGNPFGATIKHDLANADRIVNISAFALAPLSVGQKIGLAIASDKTADVIIDDVKASLTLVRAT